MWITSKGKNAVEIEDRVVTRVLGIYPEEELIRRPVFERAFKRGSIDIGDLRSEGEKILVPWQMFLLTENNLDGQLAHIQEQRKSKVSSKLLAKRKGMGEVTSKRIVDRLIRQQNFVTTEEALPLNQFCGSLKRLSPKSAAKRISSYFEIDLDRVQGISGKAKALEYFISKIEAKNVNVSRGVLAHKLLPHYLVVPSDVYRNTSGFAIKDDRLNRPRFSRHFPAVH